MQRELVLKVLIKKEPPRGYSVLCPSLDVASMGDTIPEAKRNIEEAVELYLETAKEDRKHWAEVLERLGITPQQLKRSHRIELDERITSVTVPIPA